MAQTRKVDAASRRLNRVGSRITRQLSLIVAILIASVVLSVGVLQHRADRAQQDTRYQNRINEVRLIVQRTSRAAGDAIQGREKAFAALASGRQELQAAVQSIDPFHQLPRYRTVAGTELMPAWRSYDQHLQQIHAARISVLRVHEILAAMQEKLNAIRSEADSAALIVSNTRESAQALYLTSRLSGHLQSVGLHLDQILTSPRANARMSDAVNSDLRAFVRGLVGLVDGLRSYEIRAIRTQEARGKLLSVKSLFQGIAPQISAVTDNSVHVIDAKERVANLEAAAVILDRELGALEAPLERSRRELRLWTAGGFALAAVALVCIVVLGYRIHRQELRHRQLAEQHARIESANSRHWESEVRLATHIVCPPDLLLRGLAKFSENTPETRVQLVESMPSATCKALSQGNFDIAIVGAEDVPPGLVGHPLLAIEFVAVAHRDHPLHALDHTLDHKDLEAHRQVVVRDTDQYRPVDSGWLGAEHGWTVSCVRTAIAATESGLAFAWLPRAHIAEQLSSGQLRILPLPNAGSQRAVLYLVFADRDGARRATHLLAQTLVEMARTLRAKGSRPDAANRHAVGKG